MAKDRPEPETRTHAAFLVTQEVTSANHRDGLEKDFKHDTN